MAVRSRRASALLFLLLTSTCYLLTPTQLPAAPAVVWKVSYDGPVHGEDKLTGLVTDTAGNCWFSGYSFGDTTDFDFATLRAGPQGKIEWTRRYGSPLKCEDRSWCLARDSAGSIIAAGGSIADFSDGWDFAIIKYAIDGSPAWLRRYDSPFRSDDKPAAIAVGPDNCLYVAGFAKRKTLSSDIVRDTAGMNRTDADVAVVKYSAEGDMLWERFHNGRAGADDGAAALAVDRAGNCYVAAKVTNRRPGTDIALLKYRADGTLAWSRDIDGPGHSSDLPAAVLLSDPPRASPRIYLVGSVTGAVTSFDYCAICCDTAGRLLWQQTYDGAGRVDVAAAACVDSAGNLLVTGQSAGRASSVDIATLKYAPSGKQLWVRRYNGRRNGADRGACIVAGSQDRVIVGGNSVGATGFPDLVLLGYSALGDTLWTFTHSGTGSGEAKPVALSTRRQASGIEHLLVAGYENNKDSGSDYLLMLLQPDR